MTGNTCASRTSSYLLLFLCRGMKRWNFTLAFGAMQRKVWIPLGKAESSLSWIHRKIFTEGHGSATCKSKLPKWLMRTLANTTLSLSKIGESLEELTCQPLSFESEVQVEHYLDFKDVPSWVHQEMDGLFRRSAIHQSFFCENTFWKWDLESRFPT